MNQLAPIGHNCPPDPIDEALAPFGDFISEAEGWLDGTAVENEGQMKAVDALLKQIKAAEKAASDARDVATKPLHAAWQAEIARWKPTLTDLDRIKKGLVAVVDAFKRKLAAEKEAAERAARAEAERKMREAQEAARLADAANLDAQRAAAAAQAEADAAVKLAKEAAKDTVKGLRTVTRHAVDDYRAAINWIARNDKEALAAFVDDYARRNHREKAIDGVRVWQEREAF